jgi:hypothetical protein
MASNHMLATGARAAGPLDFFLAGFAGGQPDRAIGTVAIYLTATWMLESPWTHPLHQLGDGDHDIHPLASLQ